MSKSQCFVDPGQAEITKGAVHGAMFTLAVLCATYNGCAWYLRRQRHLALNAGVYSGLACYEVWQVFRHLK